MKTDAGMIAKGQHPLRRHQMQYRYRLNYRHPRTGAVGLIVLNSAAETSMERCRLETLGYVVTDILAPIGERPKLPPISPPAPPEQ